MHIWIIVQLSGSPSVDRAINHSPVGMSSTVAFFRDRHAYYVRACMR